MRYVVGYDRDFAGQFFRRTFREVSAGLLPVAALWPDELNYMADRLAETVVFSRGRKIGSPWYEGNPIDLANATTGTKDRLLLQRAETAANQLLLIEGFITRRLHDLRGKDPESKLSPELRERVASTLYANAANAPHLTIGERAVLLGMSDHIHSWMKLLALIPGNDYWEMLGTVPSTRIILPQA